MWENSEIIEFIDEVNVTLVQKSRYKQIMNKREIKGIVNRYIDSRILKSAYSLFWEISVCSKSIHK